MQHFTTLIIQLETNVKHFNGKNREKLMHKDVNGAKKFPIF